jgi:2-polyprenyl-6-hydroxyphenyl methylase/3-demethylubiquinone-9 3-methyltransferase
MASSSQTPSKPRAEPGAEPATARAPGTAGRTTVDAAEVARFEALADEWWDPEGRFRPLHRFNPERVRFIRDHACARFGRDARTENPLAGLRLLDIGTGGGLVAEPMARLGAAVTGIDPAERNIGTARTHARRMGLDIDYRAMTAEALAAEGATYDIVLAMEVVEHVADTEAFFAAVASLTAPGGMVVAATLNRTLKAYALAIVGAEYVMRWLPVGTHDWNRFLTPGELSDLMASHGLKARDTAGLIYNPLSGRWRLGTDVSVNYLIYAERN